MTTESEISLLRGRLKHSWLENRVLNKSPADVVVLRSIGVWPALQSAFPRYIEETLDLAGRLKSGADLGALVETNPLLASLPRDVRSSLQSALQAPVDMLTLRSAPLERATLDLAAALSSLRDLWMSGDDEALAAAWDRVLVLAMRLRDELDHLPKVCGQ